MKTGIVPLAIALLCSACAILPEQVDVNYAPDPSMARQHVLSAGEMRLQVSDARRAESPNWLADKKNGYGMRLASVVAQRPVADLVRDALAQELAARGFKVGDTGPTMSVEVSRLDSVYQNRFFTMGATGTADFAVQVRRPDGGIAYAHNFSVNNDDEGSLAGTAGQARRSVESALSKVVGQVMSDPAFTAALAASPRTS